ncbi:TPR repeat protein [Chitinophaga skermanii]|uniref:TPR repeat protein n=1 Tax=Chitinophaga skermanii TaxID=331697 RepID=A0A327QVN3_9BACT|nr:tetratricopeptide repeat protein [Chitinophaga skermanii]RAJ08440.1 TPR repeat protein [Chitinophaga skermanii]
MTARYFTVEEFNNSFREEMLSAFAVYEQMIASGFQPYALATFEIMYSSNDMENLLGLKNFLEGNYQFEMEEVQQGAGIYTVSGRAEPFPVDKETMLYWDIDQFCTAFEYDCKIENYTLISPISEPEFPTMDKNAAGYYMELAMDAYRMRNLGYTIIHLSTFIRINDQDAHAFYARAIAKDELKLWHPARLDYDMALALDPNFVDAYINRAANKDEREEYAAAIEDYTKAIALSPKDEVAYYNRGNTKIKIGDKKGAYEDWVQAKELGASYAQAQIDKYLDY